MNPQLYNDYGSWIRSQFSFRVQKISIDGGFSCPNRDGTVSAGGCTFCDNRTFNPSYCDPAKSIREQIQTGKDFFARKYPTMRYLAYFQAYSNTYAPLDTLRRRYEEALSQDGVVGIVIGTRPDCVTEETLDYLEELSRSTFVIVEYGIESVDNATLKRINRGHTFECSKDAIIATHERGILTGGHIILGLPIMYGCDNFCTYCIVPYVRGREKSRKPGDILAEFRGLVEAGYKEITLLGQNVNSYGKGLEEKVDFSDLLNLLCSVPGDYQIRFMTSHPKDASHKLIDTIAAQPHLCKHLHLPVQCGSNEVLRQMNRRYTVEQYLELIEYARKTVPGITFSSDIIIGFPGETEEDFQGTLDLIRKVGYMQLFTFIYSKRTGTKAAEMPDPTPRKEKTDRMSRLLKVQDEIAMDLVKAQVGQTVRVLVEGCGRNEGTLSGRLDNNLTVEFIADPGLMGQYAQVRLTGARATVLLGELEA